MHLIFYFLSKILPIYRDIWVQVVITVGIPRFIGGFTITYRTVNRFIAIFIDFFF